MQWEFDETRPAYTLSAPPYQAIIWREPDGDWTARIDGPDESRVHHGFTWWENAQVWCEHHLAGIGVGVRREGPPLAE